MPLIAREFYLIKGDTVHLANGETATVEHAEYPHDRVIATTFPILRVKLADGPYAGKEIFVIRDTDGATAKQILVKDLFAAEQAYARETLAAVFTEPTCTTDRNWRGNPIITAFEVGNDNKLYQLFTVIDGKIWNITDLVAVATAATFNEKHRAIVTSAYDCQSLINYYLSIALFSEKDRLDYSIHCK